MAKTDDDFTALEQELEAACENAVYPYWLAGPLPSELTPWVERKQMTIDEQLAVCEAATARPWRWKNGPDADVPGDIVGADGSTVLCTDSNIYLDADDPDAKLILAASRNYPAALRAMKAIDEIATSEFMVSTAKLREIIDAFERGEYDQ